MRLNRGGRAGQDPDPDQRARLGASGGASPSLESLVVAAFALFGAGLGARPISDNSMFVHLRTGMRIVADGAVPDVDPYSFTARGTEWMVQSWLPASVYGWAERVHDLRLVVVVHVALLASLAWLVAALARTGSAARTTVTAALAVGLGAAYWTPRPLIFGLVALALTVLCVERRWHPAWLIPIVWIWVNSHGSFPLGIAWLTLRAVGDWLDARATGRPGTDIARRAVPWFAAGLALGAINPIGWRLLSFPLTIRERSDVFRSITEWQSPNFASGRGLWALPFLVVAIVVVARARPLRWADALPVGALLAMALVAQRNMPVLAVAVAPMLARALAATDRPRETMPRPARVGFGVVIAGLVAVFGAGAATRDALALDAYPVRAVEAAERAGLLDEDSRLAVQDVVGCYLILRDGDGAPGVFVDDRVDMYPVQVHRDYVTLLRGGRGVEEVLERYAIDGVLWDRSLPLVTVLAATGEWRTRYEDDRWVVLVRR